MDHQEIAFRELHRKDLEWHPVAVGSEEQGASRWPDSGA